MTKSCSLIIKPGGSFCAATYSALGSAFVSPQEGLSHVKFSHFCLLYLECSIINFKRKLPVLAAAQQLQTEGKDCIA